MGYIDLGRNPNNVPITVGGFRVFMEKKEGDKVSCFSEEFTGADKQGWVYISLISQAKWSLNKSWLLSFFSNRVFSFLLTSSYVGGLAHFKSSENRTCKAVPLKLQVHFKIAPLISFFFTKVIHSLVDCNFIFFLFKCFITVLLKDILKASLSYISNSFP